MPIWRGLYSLLFLGSGIPRFSVFAMSTLLFILYKPKIPQKMKTITYYIRELYKSSSIKYNNT